MLRGESVHGLGGRRLRLPEPGEPDTARLCGGGEVCRNPGAGVGELCTPGCFAGAEGGFELHPVRAAAWACCGTGRRCRRGVFPLLRQGRWRSLEEVTPRSNYPPDTDFHEAVEARGKKLGEKALPPCSSVFRGLVRPSEAFCQRSVSLPRFLLIVPEKRCEGFSLLLLLI